MLPVSLDCPYLIAPSVFSNVYLYHHMRIMLQNLFLWNHFTILKKLGLNICFYWMVLYKMYNFVRSEIQDNCHLRTKFKKGHDKINKISLPKNCILGYINQNSTWSLSGS